MSLLIKVRTGETFYNYKSVKGSLFLDGNLSTKNKKKLLTSFHSVMTFSSGMLLAFKLILPFREYYCMIQLFSVKS